MSSSSPVLTVRRREPILVVPAKPTPKELKQLSIIDNHVSLRFQVGLLMLYENNYSITGKDPVNVIREALAEALVSYYPLAGRLTEGPNNKLLVDCTGEGVLFVEADTDANLDEVFGIIESGGDPYSEGLLHDAPSSNGILGCPLLLFQVTRFKCGGFTFAFKCSHPITDGSGVTQFLKAVAEFARGGKTLSLPPVWKRDFFHPREPLRITCHHLEYEGVEDISPEATIELVESNMIFRSIRIGSKEINALKKYLQSQRGVRYTTYEVVTAVMWRCRTRALKLDRNQIVQLCCVADGRYQKDLEVPPGYYGNMVTGPTVMFKSETLCNSPLAYAAELVKTAKAKMSGEYFRSAMDHMASRVHNEFYTPWKFTVSDSRGLGLEEIDFGWGKPLLAGPARGNFALTFYSHFSDGVLIPMCLPETMMDRFLDELKKMLESPDILDETRSKI